MHLFSSCPTQTFEMTKQYTRLAPSTTKNYNSIYNSYLTYARLHNQDVDKLDENLCSFIVDYLKHLSQTRNSTYCVSSRAAIKNYYRPLTGDVIECTSLDNQLVYKLGNPVKHFRVDEEIAAIKRGKKRDSNSMDEDWGECR